MKQYVILKFVMANSTTEALKKAKKLPVHEVYIHGGWFEKQNHEFYGNRPATPGFKQK